MRANTAAAFVLGIATGFLILGLALWGSGAIHVPGKQPISAAAEQPSAPPASAVQEPAATAPAKQPEPSVPLDLKALTSGAKIPPPHVEPPPPQIAPPAVGGADRIAPNTASPPRLAMPIAGIDAKTLTDTFVETRDGHQHDALDIPAARGTPVLAVAEGNVAKLFTSKEGGLPV